MALTAISTPCRQVCIVDGASGLCLGCLRTLSEIANWAVMSEAERRETMAALPPRRSLIAPERLAVAGSFPPRSRDDNR